MMELNRIEAIIQAMYKSGREIIYFSDMPAIVAVYYGKFSPVTKNEFLTAAGEWLGGKNLHLILGGRKSDNPCLILYGNFYRPRNKNKPRNGNEWCWK